MHSGEGAAGRPYSRGQHLGAVATEKPRQSRFFGAGIDTT